MLLQIVLSTALLLLTSPRLLALPPLQSPAVPEPDLSVMEPQVASKIQAYREVVLVAPDSHEAWGALGMVLQAHAWKLEASECYRRAIDLEPDELRWHYLLVHAIKDEYPQDALVQAERASRVRSDYSPLYVLRGQILEQDNQLDLALEQYQKAVSIDPQSGNAEFGLGRIYLSKRELEVSLRHLLRASELGPDAAAIRSALAQAYRRMGNREAAMTEARLASELSGRIPIRDPIHFEMMREDVSSLALLAEARAAAEAGDYQTAEAIYGQLLEIRPADAVIRTELADTLARQNKHQEAKEQYLAALAIHPKHASALYGLANLLSLGKNYDEAVLRYEESLALRPDHVPSLLNLGSLLAFQGKIEEAATQFRKGLEVEPNHFGCHRQLGQLLLQQQKLPEAIVHLRAALESRPELGPLHAQLAMALAAEADFEGAWTHVKEAERLGANLPPRFLEELKRLSPEPGK